VKFNISKETKKTIKEWVESLVIAFVLAMVIRTYVIQAFKIPTGSMIPTLKIGDRLLANKFIYRFKKLERGDVIIFKSPIDKKRDFIKRLIGLPGDVIEIRNGVIFVNGERTEEAGINRNYYYNLGEYGGYDQKIVVPEDSLYVLGDNSRNSRDSRYWGFLPKKKVKGKALLVYWPLTKIRLIK